MKKDYLIVAEILKRRRLEKKLSMRKVANIVNISHTELSRIEKGEKENINLKVLIKLCKVLDINFFNLLDYAGYFNEDFSKNYEINKLKTKDKKSKAKEKKEEETLNYIIDFFNRNRFLELLFDENIILLINEITNKINSDDKCESCNYYCNICGKCIIQE